MKGDEIIRRTDFINWTGEDPNRHGGVVTLVIELDPNRRRMKLGFSFCTPEDQFIKKEGVKYAMERLRDCPIEILVLYQADHAAGEVLKALCIRDWNTLEQVTTLPIYTPAWRKAVPSWAKKWYRETMVPQPMSGIEKVTAALEDWRDEMLGDFSEAGAFATAQCLGRFGEKMRDDLLGHLPPKDKVH
jgi:hypothetical protein